jgi:hypothetical protein
MTRLIALGWTLALTLGCSGVKGGSAEKAGWVGSNGGSGAGGSTTGGPVPGGAGSSNTNVSLSGSQESRSTTPTFRPRLVASASACRPCLG